MWERPRNPHRHPSGVVKRASLTGLCLLALTGGSVAIVPRRAEAGNLCVGGGPGCFATIKEAVDAAADGDTITIGPGTFAGGITIDKSISVVGAGADATIIEGGGPVITIGEHFSTDPPTVSIADVTITGGSTTTRFSDRTPSPNDGWPTSGGGVWIPPGHGYTTGATVTISRSVITGNMVAPSAFDPTEEGCGPEGCAFASGGGIDNAGTLTLTDTEVTDNQVGPSSGAIHLGRDVNVDRGYGGGIRNEPMGTLTLRRSVVTGNRVIVTQPNGIVATGGGISSYGNLTATDTVVSDNHAAATGSFDGEVASFSGGIEISGDSTTVIERCAIRGNSAFASNDVGTVIAGAGAISTDPAIVLTIRDSKIANNIVAAAVTADGSSAVSYAGGLELEGKLTVSDIRVVGNEARVETSAGDALIGGGGIYADLDRATSVRDIVARGNRVTAEASGGFTFAAGGGVLNTGTLIIRRAVVTDNRVQANAAEGFAQGGGVWNSYVAEPEEIVLRVIDSRISENQVLAGEGVDVLGGGVYSDFPLTLARTAITGNIPDDCFGCSATQSRIGGPAVRLYV
jgi:hypothetical protein